MILVFERSSSGLVEEALFPDSGLGFTTSQNSPTVDRHDVRMEVSDKLYVTIDGVPEADLSDETLSNIKQTVPAQFLTIK